MRNYVNEFPEELKLIVDKDVAILFTEPEAMETRDVPVQWWHIPSTSVVWYCPRGLSLRGQLLCEYTGTKKFYKSEEGAARLDELLRDEELERRIRERLAQLYNLVWAQFDRAVALEDAIEVLFQATKRILGSYAEDACVVLHTNWMMSRIADWYPMSAALVEGLVSRLKSTTAYEWYTAEGKVPKNPCRKQKGPWYLYFKRLSAWDNKLHIPVSAGCGINCWGNGGATYIFVKENGQWQWDSTVGAWTD